MSIDYMFMEVHKRILSQSQSWHNSQVEHALPRVLEIVCSHPVGFVLPVL